MKFNLNEIRQPSHQKKTNTKDWLNSNLKTLYNDYFIANIGILSIPIIYFYIYNTTLSFNDKLTEMILTLIILVAAAGAQYIEVKSYSKTEREAEKQQIYINSIIIIASLIITTYLTINYTIT